MPVVESSAPLARVFRAHARVGVRTPPDLQDLERVLARAVVAARSRWPEVEVPEERFVQHLAERIDPAKAGAPLEEALEELSLPELYLTCACASEVPEAIEEFERSYLAMLPAQLGSLRASPPELQEICQKVRVHLLVRTEESGIRVGGYAGRGTLMSWVRVGAIRQALKERGKNDLAVQDDALVGENAMPEPGLDPELDLIRRRYQVEFKQAVAAGFAALAPEARYLLRLHFVDRLSTTELAGLFRVNQSTISRRLTAARGDVYDATKRDLQDRLGLSSRDFRSLLAVLDSQLDLSISRLLLEQE